MFKVLTEGCEPKRATKYSACVDVFSAEDVVIGAGETAIVPLGIAIDELLIPKCILRDFDQHVKYLDEFLESHYLALKPRSSLRAKGLISHSAVIDLDYKDVIKMIIHNPFDNHIMSDIARGIFQEFRIKKGDKIGQIMLMEHKSYLMSYKSDVERTGGIGSTGN